MCTLSVTKKFQEACPKTGGPNMIQDDAFRIIGGKLQVECYCDENEGVCTRDPTVRETARARSLGIIK